VYDARQQMARRDASLFKFPLQLRMGRYLHANAAAADAARAEVQAQQELLTQLETGMGMYRNQLVRRAPSSTHYV
jgi:hypothetical protein